MAKSATTTNIEKISTRRRNTPVAFWVAQTSFRGTFTGRRMRRMCIERFIRGRKIRGAKEKVFHDFIKIIIINIKFGFDFPTLFLTFIAYLLCRKEFSVKTLFSANERPSFRSNLVYAYS
jgi:hypothetical protein